MAKTNDRLNVMLETGFELPDEKQFYFNALTTSISGADVVIVLQIGEKPVALLRTPHSVAKSLIELLSGVIEKFEEKTQTKVIGVNDITKKLDGEDDAAD